MAAEYALLSMSDGNEGEWFLIVRYLFDMVLPASAIPVAVIIGTATPRCKTTFYRHFLFNADNF
jgi:hypothetical protein